MTALARLWRRLLGSVSGAAMTEFALSAPLLMAAGLWGVETANQAIVQMRINQIAVLIADNAARVGENSLLGDAQIFESDINDVLYGAHIQGGEAFSFYDHGRVILSSLEVVPETEDQQYIHWQRCMGSKNRISTYGLEGDGLDGELAGMGPAGQEVWAFEDEAVIFVEISYDYQSLVGETFGFSDEVHATASFTVRDDRDLSQIYQRDAGDPDPIAACDVYEDESALAT